MKSDKEKFKEIIVSGLKETIISLVLMEAEEGMHSKEIHSIAQAINFLK